MEKLRLVSALGEPIHSVDDWFQYSPPKQGAIQWKDGRSAKELAKSWCKGSGPAVPDEIRRILATHPLTANFEPRQATPEWQTPLDDFPGEPRNCDLLLEGISDGKKLVVAIEAKADESFGPLIGAALRDAQGRPSNLPGRIRGLSQAIFGRELDQAIARLRYQLLHATAGTLIEAKLRGAAAGVFLVQEFRGASCSEENLRANEGDLLSFLSKLTGAKEAGLSAVLQYVGTVPGHGRVPGDVPLLIGKVTSRV